MSSLTRSLSYQRLRDRTGEILRRSWPDVLLGVTVTVFGLLTIGAWEPFGSSADGPMLVVVALGMGVAAGLFRRAPGVALCLVWLTSMLQVANRLNLAPVQLAVVLVAYGSSRYGSTITLWASGLSVPLGAACAVGYVWLMPTHGLGFRLLSVLPPTGHSIRLLIGLTSGFVLSIALLAMPWTLGLALRLRGRAARSARQRDAAEADRLHAEEIARLREEQNRLARDVHDVVGHSLAVILAQAESAQFRPDSDTTAVRATLENIAMSARRSLRDVRQVLSSTADHDDAATTATPVPTGNLNALLDVVQAAGNNVQSTVIGTPRPLPPELDVVAVRVLQEMLTNALKHGRRDDPVVVEQRWEDQLRIEVRNVAGEEPPAPGTADDTLPLSAAAAVGRGLQGMQRRLESVGGRLDVRRITGPGAGTTFVATAFVPFRTGPG